MKIYKQEQGGCAPFIGCGIPGCLLPIVGLVTALIVGVLSLLG